MSDSHFYIGPNINSSGLTTDIQGIDADGKVVQLPVVAEKAVTIFLNNQEILTAMTLGDYLEELAPFKPKGVTRFSDLISFVDDRPGHDLRYSIDASKIQNELDWFPEESFETGLFKTIQWYIDNKNWWERVISGEYRLERIGKKK